MTSETAEQVARWLASDGVRPDIERLVNAWNEHELLGIDLADQIRELVTGQASKVGVDPSALESEVDWSELAEDLAQDICGVDEAELIRRRERFER